MSSEAQATAEAHHHRAHRFVQAPVDEAGEQRVAEHAGGGAALGAELGHERGGEHGEAGEREEVGQDQLALAPEREQPGGPDLIQRVEQQHADLDPQDVPGGPEARSADDRQHRLGGPHQDDDD